jgi:hypothetical protein
MVSYNTRLASCPFSARDTPTIIPPSPLRRNTRPGQCPPAPPAPCRFPYARSRPVIELVRIERARLLRQFFRALLHLLYSSGTSLPFWPEKPRLRRKDASSAAVRKSVRRDGREAVPVAQTIASDPCSSRPLHHAHPGRSSPAPPPLQSLPAPRSFRSRSDCSTPASPTRLPSPATTSEATTGVFPIASKTESHLIFPLSPLPSPAALVQIAAAPVHAIVGARFIVPLSAFNLLMSSGRSLRSSFDRSKLRIGTHVQRRCGTSPACGNRV